MPDDDSIIQPPPSGEPHLAERYLNKLISLINNDKISVIHTDLKKFDPSNLQDHYRIDLKEYQVEISHSKQATNGKDQYIILFTNLQNVRENGSEKIILAYMYLSEDQFRKFKLVSEDHLERKRKEEEEKRVKEALAPVEDVLDKISNGEDITKEETGRDDVIEENASSIYQLEQATPLEEETISPEENSSTEEEKPSSQADSTTL